MSGEHNGYRTLKGAAQRGLLKLMLKLPSVRGKIQVLAARSESLVSMCEAYGEASSMLERLESGRAVNEGGILDEYRAICTEIENDVIRYCLEHR